MKGYTLSGAYQLRMEGSLGSVEVGKAADLVVLDKNIFEISRYDIHRVAPEAVLIEGKVVSGRLPQGSPR